MLDDRATRILVVDDDPIVREAISRLLIDAGYASESCPGTPDVFDRLQAAENRVGGAAPFTVAIIEMSITIGGLDLIRTIRKRGFAVAPIAISGYGTIESAVKAVRAGALDYLTKPVVDRELLVAVEQAVQRHALMSENRQLRRQLDDRDGLENIIGGDEHMRKLYDVIEAVAPTRTTVLMLGESGTGKSLIARAIHRRSPRATAPFVEISCGSIPESLLESELFGHVKGAFTGAHTDKPGRFLAAHGGTLFLDEINSASPGMQLKLLRVLQERTFEPVGSNEPVEVDVRIILAANQPLEDLVERGEFRQDLYYRVNVVNIPLPPLRERISDIPLLAQHFLDLKCAEVDRQVAGFSDEAMRRLVAYDWPGNVRELENVIERAVVLSRTAEIEVEDLPPQLSGERVMRIAGPHGPAHPMSLREALEEPERQIILSALEANDWNRQATADQLDINRTTLYKKIKHYGLAG